MLLSVKPEFANLIIEGKKTVELRRKFPIDKVIGGMAVIYASSPIQKIIGYACIENVLYLNLDEIWYQYAKQCRVERSFFDRYFDNLQYGFAVQLTKPVQFKKQVSLQELKDKYSIAPPQSYRYLSPEILEGMTILV